MIRTEITGAEIAEEMEKERRLFQLHMCEVTVPFYRPLRVVAATINRKREKFHLHREFKQWHWFGFTPKMVTLITKHDLKKTRLSLVNSVNSGLFVH